MEKVLYSAKGSRLKFAMRDCESICVVRDGKPEFYHVIMRPMFEYGGNHAERAKLMLVYVFRDVAEVVAFYLDNIDSDRYFKPAYEYAFATIEDYYKWFNRLEW